MTATHARRRERLAALLPAHEADALLVTRAVNVRYLTGLNSSNAAVLVRADATAVLATDSRYAETARSLCEGVEVAEERDVAGALVTRASGVAVEAHHLPVADYFRLAERRGGEPLRLTGLVESVRRIKDEAELALIRTACALSDQAFADVLPALRPGLTEREVARALEARMVELGAEKPAFDTIVASGPNGSVPHHAPGDRPLERGDLVTMDFGALHAGYHADMTRTVAIGEPAAWQRELYELVRTAQRAGRRAVRPGAATHEVDAAARDVIAGAGYGEHFGHGLGHGVGLEIHEEPFLSPATPEKARGHGRLDDRVPVTVEPGVYLPGRGGVRIEDTLVTREDGPELLTRTTKELLVL
ncbi:M24 family metallopeptidase [Planomonospora venezuelensis]|uniref:Xaa-Pro aminopeptidase n=1 Tax=Planomonospora venezuelensis TaxID=1999 RepID=A0A841D8L6_PLAVE|nr:Xaa-Pro peptidase family protein [Planomonospora venezuelensis]MBB5964834.1 Xaa-Pro aminopeptidase [Planomonospora venezuelensis]GIM99321.1 X-Pro dipeptidase [Planomonospora venezuelensis]